jgi:hydroxyacylglutathione hydrolase
MSLQIDSITSQPLGTNVYLVADSDEKKAWVIDPSFAGVAALRRLQKNGWELAGILLTHGHVDHAHDAARLALETGASVYAHTEALPFLQDAVLCGATYLGLPFASCDHVRSLSDGDRVTMGKKEFQVLHTPGHTPGCICLLAEDKSVCFTGDLVFNGSVGRSDFPGGSHAVLQQSIKRLLGLCLPETVLYPGHGPETTSAFERVNNPYIA